MRADLSDDLADRVEQLAEVAAAADPEAAIVVIVDAEGAHCPVCNEEYRQLCDALTEALAQHGIELYAAHVVDQVALGGRWHCVDGCGAGGAVDDPSASPLAAAAVLEGRRLYSAPRRPAGGHRASTRRAAPRWRPWSSRRRPRARSRTAPIPPGCSRRDVENADGGRGQGRSTGNRCPTPSWRELGCALSDMQVRDTLYALAVAENADEAESLWAVLARTAAAAVAGRGAGVARVQRLRSRRRAAGRGIAGGRAALRPDHRMAGMLDTALQSGLRPKDIRELASTGYRLAKQLGVRLPPRRAFGRRAG